MVPVFVDVVLPKLGAVGSDKDSDRLVEFWKRRILWVGFPFLVSLVDFLSDVLWEGYVVGLELSFGDEMFIGE